MDIINLALLNSHKNDKSVHGGSGSGGSYDDTEIKKSIKANSEAIGSLPLCLDGSFSDLVSALNSLDTKFIESVAFNDGVLKITYGNGVEVSHDLKVLTSNLSINDITDVDMTDVQDGMYLYYSATDKKIKCKTSNADTVLQEAKDYTDTKFNLVNALKPEIVSSKPTLADATDGQWYLYNDGTSNCMTVYSNGVEFTMDIGDISLEDYVNKNTDVASTFTGSETDTTKVADIGALLALYSLINTSLGDKINTSDIVDNLTTQDSNKGLSANMGYVISQKFMKDITFNSITKNVDITYLDGTEKSFSLKTFIDDICKTLAQGKAVYCDSLPTCTQDNNGDYIVTYIQNGNTLNINAENTWFYYKNDDSIFVQTLFVDGTEITMQAGTIGDVITIDSTTKHWLINNTDTGVLAEGFSPLITENANNTDTLYKLDIKSYDSSTGNYSTTTTPNLHGADGVILDNTGYFGLRVENNQLMLYVNVADESDADSQAPPFSLEGNTLYYTVGGTIQYASKETVE